MANGRSLGGRLFRNREARTVLAFSVSGLVLTLVGNRLLTEWVAPRELGTYYMYMNVVLWLALPGAGAYNFVLRYWLEAKRVGAARDLLRFLSRLLAIEAAAAAVVVVAFSLLSSTFGRGALLAIWVSGVAQAATQSISPAQAAERRRVGVGLFALAGTPVRILALALTARLGLDSAPQLLATHALIVSLISVAAWAVVRILSEGSSGGSLRSVTPEAPTRAFLGFAGPYLGTAVLTQVCTTSERWGLARLESSAATALFVLSLSLATAGASAAASPLMAYFQPLIVEAVSKRDSPSALRALRRLTLSTSAVMLAGALTGITLGPLAARVLFGAKYLGVAAVLPWTVLGACAFALGQALANYPFSGGDSKAANGALALSQICYATILLTYHPAESPAVAFGRVFAGTQVGYLGLMSIVAWRWRRQLVGAIAPASAERST